MKKLLVCLMLFSGLSVLAQDKQTLDLLVSKGIITRQEADDVVKKSSAEIVPNRSTTKSITLIGRAQTQFENISVRENINGTSHSLETKNNFILRRVFLGMEADLGADWTATVIADFARSSSGYLEYAYVSKKYDGEILNGTFDVGYKKIAFNLEEYSSSSQMTTIERSIASRYFSETANDRRLGLGGRHTGVFWSGKIPQLDCIKYGVSITNSYNNNPTSSPANASQEFLYGANIAYVRTFENSITINAGLNFIYSNSVNTDSSNNHKGDVYGINPYIKLSSKNISLWSELLLANIDNAKSNYEKSAMPWGVNTAIEYKFDAGELGQIAPIARFAYLDTDGRGTVMGDGIRNAASGEIFDNGWSIYIGLNWYIIGDDLKLQLGYEYTRLKDSPTQTSNKQNSEANSFRTQLQVLF